MIVIESPLFFLKKKTSALLWSLSLTFAKKQNKKKTTPAHQCSLFPF